MGKVIETFYQAFKTMDAETMVACYHDEVLFTDPAFGTLKGESARNMWRMLVSSQKGKDFEVYFDSVYEDDEKGSAHWEAKYTFSVTGRKIHNKIEAEFVLRDGKILRHRDHFNLHRWAIQALGFKGFLVGHTRFFQNKLQKQTRSMLSKFEANQSAAKNS
jgi:ketosteroid isomerase-like protein